MPVADCGAADLDAPVIAVNPLTGLQFVSLGGVVQKQPHNLWGRSYLDFVELAIPVIHEDGQGEIAFGALNASLDLEYGRSTMFFTWAGFDEMDEVNGSGSAELLDDGSLESEFAYHLGDKATLKAEPVTFSAAC